jgi:uncharacterized phage-associated protein
MFTERRPMANVDDVAAAVLRRAGSVDTFKLEKLVYYCQAWHLAWEGRPMFQARIEAWANGPVVPKLYQQHRGTYRVSRWGSGDARRLDPREASTVDAVVKYYNKYDGWQLAQITHNERPWIEARRGLAPGARGKQEITTESMRDYYLGLVR